MYFKATFFRYDDDSLKTASFQSDYGEYDMICERLLMIYSQFIQFQNLQVTAKTLKYVVIK